MTALAARWLVAALVLVPAPPGPKPDFRGRGFLGVQVSQTADNRIVVGTVIPNSAAARHGLRAGDVIQKIGELEARNQQEFIAYVGSLRPGTRLAVELVRDGKPLRVAVRLGNRPEDTQLLPDD